MNWTVGEGTKSALRGRAPPFMCTHCSGAHTRSATSSPSNARPCASCPCGLHEATAVSQVLRNQVGV